MSWTAPTPGELPDGPLVGDDRPILEAFLADARHTLLNICSGLTPEQLAERAVPPSNLSLLGLVRHMAKVERIWFRIRAAGLEVPMMYGEFADKDADYNKLDPLLAEADFASYQNECVLADEAAAALSLDHTFVVRGDEYSLRLIYIHMIAEYSRHNGHADLLRERIDGTTGR